jgi:hypothetical protein
MLFNFKVCLDKHQEIEIKHLESLTSRTGGGRVVGIIRLQTTGHGVFFLDKQQDMVMQETVFWDLAPCIFD